MSVYSIAPNQPLGWSETIPTDGCGCEKHEYCAPLLFEFSNYVYEAYTSRAVADGALATDIPEACMTEIIDEFYRLSESIRYVSENISFLYQKSEEQEPCDNLAIILADDKDIAFDPEFVNILTPEEPGYVAGAIGFSVDGSGPEPTSLQIDFSDFTFLAPGCDNTFTLTITPFNEQVDPWQIIVRNSEGDEESILSQGDPAEGFSVTFELSVGAGGFIIDIPAGDEGVFVGTISLRAMYVPCSFEPLGLVTSETSEVIGAIVEGNVVTDTINEVDYSIFNGKVGLNEQEIDNGCYYIKFGSLCCCTDIFYSKCIKPITDDCHTVKIQYWQTPTITDGAFGFDFYYPAATLGGESKQFMRVWGEVRNPQYDGETTTYEDSFGRKAVVYAESREFRSFIVNYSPEYVHDALRLACRHENFVLTDSNYGITAENFYTRSETYSPTWIRISKLAPVTLEVEKKTQNLIGGSSKTFCS